jgi:hypothetical protein
VIIIFKGQIPTSPRIIANIPFKATQARYLRPTGAANVDTNQTISYSKAFQFSSYNPKFSDRQKQTIPLTWPSPHTTIIPLPNPHKKPLAKNSALTPISNFAPASRSNGLPLCIGNFSDAPEMRDCLSRQTNVMPSAAVQAHSLAC